MICYNWNTQGQRCTQHAAFWFIQPDGERNPGGWVCAEHGLATVKEYAEKIGQYWTLQPIDDLGNPS